MRIAINGLGRIGRSVIRRLFEHDYQNIKLIAANGPASIQDHAHLIKYDSIHGRFNADVKIEDNYLIINGKKIIIMQERNPEDIDWRSLDIDIVFECSGKFNNKNDAMKHINSGAKKVLVSAPCEGADRTIVYGVNHAELSDNDQVISIGSCTTNALAPIVKILNESIGIEQGFMTTIHSYTNDQNIVDASHKDIRRARAACMSMIPTKTGAADAIGLVLPSMQGKIGGAAVRVPTPNVSLIDLCFNAGKNTSTEEINNIMKNAANGHYKNILSVATEKLVSVDFNHTDYSSIFDPFETNVIGNKFCRVISWYDNEWGFTSRMLDVALLLVK